MPSKLGFGNSRTPMTKKVSYGSAMHYKNPVKKMDPMYNNEPGVQKEDFAQFSKESPMDMYGKAPVKKMDKKKKGALIADMSEVIGSAISGAASNIDTSVNKERA